MTAGDPFRAACFSHFKVSEPVRCRSAVSIPRRERVINGYKVGMEKYFQAEKMDVFILGQFAQTFQRGNTHACPLLQCHRLPAFLKVDLSPLCNIRCTVCVHAEPPEPKECSKYGRTFLYQQKFHSKQLMPLDQYRRVIDELRGKTLAVVLHYLGEPFMYPELDEAARIAFDAGMRVHVGSNFSFAFSDERIESILHSGITDLTVCVDGATQEIYERTRVGGKIDRVLDNLRRLCEKRKVSNPRKMHIEVQYIQFEHNKHEKDAVRDKVLDFGVDQFTAFNGNTGNWTNSVVVKDHYPPRKSIMPYCYWPYTNMVIRYDGEVIPCCLHHRGIQYTEKADFVSLGNAFVDGVKKIWRSKHYRELRRQVFTPALVGKDSFCYGCYSLFDTERKLVFVLDQDKGGLTIRQDTDAV